jgi:acyl-CoA thioesterase II
MMRQVTVPPQLPIFTLEQLLDTFHLEQVNADFFVGEQLDEPGHHIIGGHIAAQALIAASRTVPQRRPHSSAVSFLRRGDARQPADFEVTALHDGRTFATRRVTARQSGHVLLEAMVSFSVQVDDVGYQQHMPENTTSPESLSPAQQQLAAYAGELNGWWIRKRPIEMRYVDPPARLAFDMADAPPARTRLWWRPDGTPPADPILTSALLVYASGLTLPEPAMIARRTTPIGPGLSALVNQVTWFHQQADLSDWLLCDQDSPSGTGGRGLATGTMFNRTGQLVSTATLEAYFGRSDQPDSAVTPLRPHP